MTSEETPKKRALVLMIDQNEDAEVAITTYCFRLAGVETILAGVEGPEPVKCAYGITIVPDMSLEEAIKTGPFDIILIPGGFKGADSFAKNKLVGEILHDQERNGRFVGGICCGSGYTITEHEIYKGKKLTTYPRDDVFERVLEKNTHELVKDEPVVVDGPLITAMGPGICYSFALRAIREVCGTETEEKVIKNILWDKVKL